MNRLTQEKLKEVLDYNSSTGVFTWKISKNNIKSGDIAGSIRKDGYIQIQVNKKIYLAHRLAWLYVYGYLPENFIDHINRKTNDNKISNLREVGYQCNSRNCENHSTNKSGIKGIYWNKKHKKYYSQIIVNNKTKYLGNFDNFDEAVCHRLAAEQCLNWSGCDSNSPAYQYIIENIQRKNNEIQETHK